VLFLLCVIFKLLQEIKLFMQDIYWAVIFLCFQKATLYLCNWMIRNYFMSAKRQIFPVIQYLWTIFLAVQLMLNEQPEVTVDCFI
jgi:hypothetical protein